MLGVVLWSDSHEHKAVIWCEDHGDLAFYRQDVDDVPIDLDAGDWVQFDLTMESQMRFAHNPRRVSEDRYRDVAGVVSQAGAGATRKPPADPPAKRWESAKILCFPRKSGARAGGHGFAPAHV